MITKKDIIKQLSPFSGVVGKSVIVHSSLRAIGEIEGGAQTLLSALIDFFTQKDGLLCIPSHTWDNRVMDLRKPTSCIGTLPKISTMHPAGKRSLHPTHSMVVFGSEKRAKDFLENEKFVKTPTSPEGCYGNLYKDDGYVLLIGVDQRKNTFLHCVEEMLGVERRYTTDMVDATIIYENGEKEMRYLYWFDDSVIGDVSQNFGKFEKAFRFYNCIEDGFLGNAKTQLCSTKKMKEVMEIIYKNAGEVELLADDLPLDERLYIK